MEHIIQNFLQYQKIIIKLAFYRQVEICGFRVRKWIFYFARTQLVYFEELALSSPYTRDKDSLYIFDVILFPWLPRSAEPEPDPEPL